MVWRSFFRSLMCICSLFEYKQSTSHQIAYELNFHKFMAEFSIEFRFFDPFSICAQFLCVFRVIPMKNASTQKEWTREWMRKPLWKFGEGGFCACSRSGKMWKANIWDANQQQQCNGECGICGKFLHIFAWQRWCRCVGIVVFVVYIVVVAAAAVVFA